MAKEYPIEVTLLIRDLIEGTQSDNKDIEWFCRRMLNGWDHYRKDSK